MKRTTLAVLALVAVTFTTQAQRSLGQLVDEAGVGWLIGTWTQPLDRGGDDTYSFSWDLDRHMIIMHTKNPGTESKGIIMLHHKTGEVWYAGVRARGDSWSGVWSLHEGNPCLTLEQSRPGEDKPSTFALLFKRGENDTMSISAFFKNDGQGAWTLEDEPAVVTEYRRSKKS